MRRTIAVVALLAVSCLARAAFAQQQNPISFEAISKAKSGQWAEYTMSMKGQPQSITMRYALVERDAKTLGLEVNANTPMGLVLMHMTFTSTAPETWNMTKSLIQINGQKKTMTAQEMKSGDIKKTDAPGKLIGSESVTVPGGTFQAKHYQRSAQMPGQPAPQTIDVWMSDKAMPTGLVKMTAANGVEAVLSNTGSDAKAQLSYDAPGDKPADASGASKPAGKPQK